MNRTKIIYFLSAFVLIIGCYALNTSYSLFVQTDTINNVSSSVPSLSYSLGDNEFSQEKILVKANSEDLVKVKVNNLGSSDIKYVLSLIENIEGVNVQLIKLDNNDLIGNLSSQNSKYIWFRISNTNLEDKEINFSLLGTYYTLDINDENVLSNMKIDLENLYIPTIKETILINSINARVDKTLVNNTLYIDDLALLEEDNSRGLLLTLEDDYTETTDNKNYYFNGNVIDNYINFANMCWRVVNIDGNNNVKLVLEDIDNVCEESDGNYSIPINEVTEDTTKVIYNGTYGYNVNKNEQVILDYLNPSTESLYNDSMLVNDYSMVNVFKKFQNKLTDYLSYMELNGVCIENTLYEDENGEVIADDINTNYNNWVKMYYKDYINVKNNITTLKCNGTKVDKYNDNTDMYVSALNVNEVMLAGINNNDNNFDNYLMNSYSLNNDSVGYKGVNFWTISPSHFDGLRSYAYTVNSNGNLVSIDLLDNNTSFRPTIVLSRNNKVLNGSGIKTNPYNLYLEESIIEQ